MKAPAGSDTHKTASPEFLEETEAASGQKVRICYQCGKCSAGCPVGFAMDLLPNQVMRLIQLGLKDEALSCSTIWLCASCMTCMARCPKGVDLAKVMEALRLLSLRKNIDHVDILNIDAGNLPQIAVVSNLRKFTA